MRVLLRGGLAPPRRRGHQVSLHPLRPVGATLCEFVLTLRVSLHRVLAPPLRELAEPHVSNSRAPWNVRGQILSDTRRACPQLRRVRRRRRQRYQPPSRAATAPLTETSNRTTRRRALPRTHALNRVAGPVATLGRLAFDCGGCGSGDRDSPPSLRCLLWWRRSRRQA